jgi:3-hydroxyacyl-CoA dehydrogenase
MANNPMKLSDAKAGHKPLATNASASVWDVGDSVACLEFHSKMNTIDLGTIAMGIEAVTIASNGMRALLIHNEATHFSVGANIGMFLTAANSGDWAGIDMMVTRGQTMMRAFKFSPVPVVAAPAGLALGGGCEVLLHCAAVQAHAGLSTGLVEPLVGLIPGWGGCKELLIRKGANGQEDVVAAILASFEQVTMTKTSKSAVEAKELTYLRDHDGISTNLDHLFADAKTLALRLAENYMPPHPVHFHLPGQPAIEKMMEVAKLSGKTHPHDHAIAHHLAKVLSGGEKAGATPVTEDDVFELEKLNFIALCKMPATAARIDAMLKTGKPLRN